MVICTDAGHGATDSGASYNGIYEKDVNLGSTLILNSLLRKMNHRVFTTRTDDVTVPPLGVRTKLVNAHHAAKKPPFDAIVSIHCNAAGRLDSTTNTYKPVTTVRGLYVVYSQESSESTSLANIIRDSCQTEGILFSHKGMISTVELGRTLAWIHKTIPVSILVELGYLTCPEECILLKDQMYISKLMNAIATGIDQYGKSAA